MELVEDGEETGFWLVVLGSEAPGEHVGIRQAGDTAGGGGKEHGALPRADRHGSWKCSEPPVQSSADLLLICTNHCRSPTGPSRGTQDEPFGRWRWCGCWPSCCMGLPS